MKNFFTSVMAALFMAAPVGNLSAQLYLWLHR